MPTIDLSDDDLALLDLAKKVGGAQGIDMAVRARKLHDTLYTHKDTAIDYQKAIKKAFPDAKVAADMAEPYVARVASVEDRMEKFLADQAEEKRKVAEDAAQNDFETRWKGVVGDYKLTPEGEEKLQKFMVERKNADPEAAAALYFKQNPEPIAPVTPTSIAPQGWARDMGFVHDEDDKDTKSLISNPDAWADKEAAAVLTEIRRQAA